MLIELVDYIPGAEKTPALLLQIQESTVTVRDLIRFRVEAEVDRQNFVVELAQQQTNAWDAETRRRQARWLVTPNPAEVALNGERGAFGAGTKPYLEVQNNPSPKAQPCFDIEAMVQTAWNGFEENAYLVLIDDGQANALDDVLTLREATEVVFVRLTPLVGG
jgi:hypothetical protein